MRKKMPEWLNSFGSIFYTIGYFAFTLIFFRANTVTEALTILKRIFTARGPLFIENPSMVLFSILGIIFIILTEVKNEYFKDLFKLSDNRHWLVRTGFYCLLIIGILVAGVFDGGEFIYFQF